MESSCLAGAIQYHTIVYYSHLIPVAISAILGSFVLVKARASYLSRVFFAFIVVFCLWLVGDNIAWLAQNYNLVTFSWSLLDYLNILFYLLAAYFFVIMVRDGSDIPWWQKAIVLALSIPAWWITSTGKAIVDFNQPFCEATNNSWLTNYKLVIEVLTLAFIMFYGLFSFIKTDNTKRRQIILVGTSLILFLATFASTEYISSSTGVYEINLYSLFVLPVFLAMIIFSITNLRIFAYKSFGTQLLIYVLLIMVGSQFFFLQDATYRILTLVTFALSLFLGTVLARNIRREEQLAVELQVSNEGQATLIHFINHQIKGFLNKGKIVFNELLTDPDYGPIPETAKGMLTTGESAMNEGVDFVQQILRASDIEKGTFVYSKESIDLKEIVTEIAEEKKGLAETKGLEYTVDIGSGDYKLNADKAQLKEAVKNFIDNSIVYTEKGSVKVRLERQADKILFSVKDTGVGLDDEVKKKLFTKGGRSVDSLKINVNSTGYGLAIVKGVAEAHKGKVWAESEGKGKGSTFYMELPLA